MSLVSASAEMAVVGACLIAPRAFQRCRKILDPADFHEVELETIWRVMGELRDSGSAIDIVTVRAGLTDRGLIEKVGGVGNLIRISNEFASTSAAEDYAWIVKDKSIRRQTLQSLRKAAEIAKTGDREELESLLADTARMVSGAQTGVVMFSDAMTNLRSRDERFFKTGHFIDDVTGGYGIIREEPTVLIGSSGAGKTRFGIQVMAAMAKVGIKSAIYSAEMSVDGCAERIAQNLSGAKCRGENPEGWDHAVYLLEKCGSVIKDTSLNFGDARVYDVMSFFEDQMEHGAQCGVIDYAQLLTAGIVNNWQDQTKCSMELKRFCLVNQFPIIVLSQIKIEGQGKDKEITTANSKQWFKDAGHVMVVATKNSGTDEHPEWESVFIVEKNRHGIRFRKRMTVDPRTLNFEVAS